MLSSTGFYLNLKHNKKNVCSLKLNLFIQLFGRFSEQRRLKFCRFIFRGLVGFNSQINGIRFLQSNIFQDLKAVSATQPRRVSSLKIYE